MNFNEPSERFSTHFEFNSASFYAWHSTGYVSWGTFLWYLMSLSVNEPWKHTFFWPLICYYRLNECWCRNYSRTVQGPYYFLTPWNERPYFLLGGQKVRYNNTVLYRNSFFIQAVASLLFNNYMNQLLNNFDPHPPQVDQNGHFTYYKLVHVLLYNIFFSCFY